MNHSQDGEPRRRSLWGTWQGLCILGLAAAMIFYLFTEHTAHTFGALPFVIFLLCPILHLFMHRGHGGHGGHGSHDDAHNSKTESQPDERAVQGRRSSTHGGHH